MPIENIVSIGMPAASVYAAMRALRDGGILAELKRVHSFITMSDWSFVELRKMYCRETGQEECCETFYEECTWGYVSYHIVNRRISGELERPCLVLFNAEGWADELMADARQCYHGSYEEALACWLPRLIDTYARLTDPTKPTLWLNLSGRRPGDERYERIIRHLDYAAGSLRGAYDVSWCSPKMYTVRLVCGGDAKMFPSPESDEWIRPSDAAVYHILREYLRAPEAPRLELILQAIADDPRYHTIPHLIEMR